MARGAYVLADPPEGDPEVILIATGSEVAMTVDAYEQLTADGIRARVVSMPSMELFDQQPAAYRDEVLPPSVTARVAVEKGSPFGWDRWVGPTGAVIGMSTFGESAPMKVLQAKFGFTTEQHRGHRPRPARAGPRHRRAGRDARLQLNPFTFFDKGAHHEFQHRTKPHRSDRPGGDGRQPCSQHRPTGVPVAVHNRTAARTKEFMNAYGGEGAFTPAESVEDFVAALEKPRRIIVMVKAGNPVDAVIDELTPLLDQGDIIIDAGNSHFPDTNRRSAACAANGLRFMGVGVSGGEEGALLGPSIARRRPGPPTPRSRRS